MAATSRKRHKHDCVGKGQHTRKKMGGKSIFHLFKRRSSKQMKQNKVFHGIVEEHKLSGYFIPRKIIKPLVVTCNSSILDFTRTHPQKDEIQMTLVFDYKQLLDVILQKLNVSNIIHLGSKNENEKKRCTKLFCKNDISTNEELLNFLHSSASSAKVTSSEMSDILECKDILALQTVNNCRFPKNLLTQNWAFQCDDMSMNSNDKEGGVGDRDATLPDDDKELALNSSMNSKEKHNLIALIPDHDDVDSDHSSGGNGLFKQSFGSLNDDLKIEILRALHSKLSVKLDDVTSTTVNPLQIQLTADDHNSIRLLKILNKFNSNVARFGQRNKSVLKLTRSISKSKRTQSKSSSSTSLPSDDEDNKAKVYIKVLFCNIYNKKKGWISINSSKTLYDTLVDLIKDEKSIVYANQKLLSCVDKDATLDRIDEHALSHALQTIEENYVLPEDSISSSKIVETYFQSYVHGREEWVDPLEFKQFYERYVLRKQHGLYAVQQNKRLQFQYELAQTILNSKLLSKQYKTLIKSYKKQLRTQFHVKQLAFNHPSNGADYTLEDHFKRYNNLHFDRYLVLRNRETQRSLHLKLQTAHERKRLIEIILRGGALRFQNDTPYMDMMKDNNAVNIVNGETSSYLEIYLKGNVTIVVKKIGTDTVFNCKREPKLISFRKWVTGTGRDVKHTPFSFQNKTEDFLKRLDPPSEFTYDTYTGRCKLRIKPLTRHSIMNKKIEQVTLESKYQLVLAHPKMLLAHTGNVTVTYKRMKFFFWLGGHTQLTYVIIKNKSTSDNAYVWLWNVDGIGEPTNYPLLPILNDKYDDNMENLQNQFKSNLLIRNHNWTAMKAPMNWVFTIKRQKFWIRKNHNLFMRISEGWGHIFFTWELRNKDGMRKNDTLTIYNSDVILYNSHVKKFDRISWFRSESLGKSRYAKMAKSNLTRLAEISTIAAAIMGGHVALAVSNIEAAAHIK